MTNLHDVLDESRRPTDRRRERWAWWPAATGSRSQAVGSVDADGTRPDGPGLDLPDRLDHQAHHRRGGHDAGRGRPDRAGRPGRAVAAGAGVTDGRPHAGRPGRRRGPGRPADHRASTCSPSAPATASRPTSRCPAVGLLFSELKQGPPQPQLVAAPDEWMAALSGIPLLHQPGEAWLYNTCSDILGVLVARASGRPLPEFLAERLFEPLGMVDTGFAVPAGKRDRFTSYYRADAGGRARAGRRARTGSGAARRRSRPAPAGWSRPSTTGYAFARMLLADGAVDGRQLLSPALGAADDHRPADPGAARRRHAVPGGPGLGLRRLGRHRGRSSRGTCRAATAGSAAPVRRRTSRRPPARSPSCSPSWR